MKSLIEFLIQSLHRDVIRYGLYIGVFFIIENAMYNLYSNHIDQAYLQLSRSPKDKPKLEIRRNPSDIFSYKYDDFTIHNYISDQHIKAKVAI